MCQSGVSQAGVNKACNLKHASPDLVEQAKRQLNPGALDFISSRSSSAVSSPEASPCSEADSEEAGVAGDLQTAESPSEEHPAEEQYDFEDPQKFYDQNGPYYAHRQMHWGWESPQVCLIGHSHWPCSQLQSLHSLGCFAHSVLR